jgi:hypothetical protein
MALMVSLAFGFVFLYRIVGAAFSSQIRHEIRKKPFAHFLMFCAIPISVGLFLLIYPTPLKIHEERKIVLERVKMAGGWNAITRDCFVIANQWTNYEIYVRLARTNSVSLPPAIAALKPYEVRCYPDASVRQGESTIPIVRIHVVGLMSTDNAWPRYWLWIVCGETAKNHVPKTTLPNIWHSESIRKITDSVFEVIDY